MTPWPVQHGGGVKMVPYSSRPEPPSVLRVRADCGGRLLTAKFEAHAAAVRSAISGIRRCNALRTRSLKLASDRANRHTLKAASAAAILVSEFPVPRVKRRMRRNGFRQSGVDWETAACVKMETEASVLVRPLIATPAQGVSRSRAETAAR
jgi:hypothetical protein